MIQPSRWIPKLLLLTPVLALIVGSGAQWAYDSRIARAFPPSGTFADLGAHRIHFRYGGDGNVTFVLIGGLGESMHTWSTIEHELEARGRVFRYDRPGLGHSEAGALPRSVDRVAEELQTVLRTERIPGPYVLVGHSIGGFIARYYAHRYPDEVLGVFLIDPYAEMGKAAVGEWPLMYKALNWSLRHLAWSGLPYVLLPNPPHPIYKTTRAIKAYGDEAFAEDVSLRVFAALDTGVSTLPLYLLTADTPSSAFNAQHHAWHTEIFAKYANAINRHVVIASGHHIHIQEPTRVLAVLDEFVGQLEP